ncbi:MAG TPA: DUF5317 domain-containing protein [Acidimicrobiia bacterium]|nr:DUF5317 domain-containing protein [Acidimicrobiia bacterium]
MVEAVALLLALVLVPATGGSFRRLAQLDFEAPWLLFGGLAIQIVLLATDVIPAARVGDLGVGLLLASYVLILGFGVMNLKITGMAIVTIGIALNAVVISANQGMPYRPHGDETREVTVKHRPERRDDVLTVLDDRIYVPGPLAESVSFGDLILAVGIIDVAYRGSRRPRRTRSRSRRSRESGAGDEPGPPRPATAAPAGATNPPGVAHPTLTPPESPVGPLHVDLVAEEHDPDFWKQRRANRRHGDAASSARRWPLRAPWYSRHPTLRRLEPPPPPPGAVPSDVGSCDAEPPHYGATLRSLRDGDAAIDAGDTFEHPLQCGEHPRVVDVPRT